MAFWTQTKLDELDELIHDLIVSGRAVAEYEERTSSGASRVRRYSLDELRRLREDGAAAIRANRGISTVYIVPEPRR